MVAKRQDLPEAAQGTTWGVRLLCQNPDGSPTQFGGFTGRMQIRDGYSGEAPIVELSTANGGMVLGSTDGSITLAIEEVDATVYKVGSATTQTGRPAKDYVYDLEVASGSLVTELLYGVLPVTGRVTHG